MTLKLTKNMEHFLLIVFGCLKLIPGIFIDILFYYFERHVFLILTDVNFHTGFHF